MLIVTERLEIRPAALSDAEETAALMTPAVARNLLSWQSPTVVEEVRRRICEGSADPGRHAPLNLAVRRKHDRRLLGWIGVWRTGPDQTFRLGFWLGEAFQNCGFMAEALAAAFPQILRRFRIAAIEAEAFEDNLPSIRLLEHLGMRQYDVGMLNAPARPGRCPTIKFRLEIR